MVFFQNKRVSLPDTNPGYTNRLLPIFLTSQNFLWGKRANRSQYLVAFSLKKKLLKMERALLIDTFTFAWYSCETFYLFFFTLTQHVTISWSRILGAGFKDTLSNDFTLILFGRRLNMKENIWKQKSRFSNDTLSLGCSFNILKDLPRSLTSFDVDTQYCKKIFEAKFKGVFTTILHLWTIFLKDLPRSFDVDTHMQTIFEAKFWERKESGIKTGPQK